MQCLNNKPVDLLMVFGVIPGIEQYLAECERDG